MTNTPRSNTASQTVGKKIANDTSEGIARLPGLTADIGRYSYGVPTVQYAPHDSRSILKIGAFCSIAGYVEIFCGMGGRHPLDFLTTFPMTMVFDNKPKKYGKSVTEIGDLSVHIGSDVWIGQSAIILNGVKIGHGAVIGAGCVVRKDVQPYEIVAGNPQKHIRYRFPRPMIDRLLALRWWDWPDELLNENIDLFYSPDMMAIINRLEKIRPAHLPDDKGPVITTILPPTEAEPPQGKNIVQKLITAFRS